MKKHLHIVSFDVPFPPDYGGVIPIFSLLKSLHEAGLGVHLHCFEYGRGQQAELNKYCEEVKYYQRRKGIKGFSLTLPYIVSSRISEELRQSLLKDSHPILMEGVHCSYLAFDPEFKDRKISIRIHNVESSYYQQLCRSTADPVRKLYYYLESRLLVKYERQLAKKTRIIALSSEDAHVYKRELGATTTVHLPMIVPYKEVLAQPGKGSFCLYHGNLSVAENEKAVAWLIQKVFNELNLPLVIAGKKPGARIKKIISKSNNVTLVEDPGEEEMKKLISEAQINVLPSFNSTGIKLKFLNALFNGRHCVVNAATACSTQVASLCHIADDENEFKSIISRLYAEDITVEEIENRKKVLLKVFDNPTNTRFLVQWIC